MLKEDFGGIRCKYLSALLVDIQCLWFMIVTFDKEGQDSLFRENDGRGQISEVTRLERG